MSGGLGTLAEKKFPLLWDLSKMLGDSSFCVLCCILHQKKKFVLRRGSEDRKEGGLERQVLHVTLLLFQLCDLVLELFYLLAEQLMCLFQTSCASHLDCTFRTSKLKKIAHLTLRVSFFYGFRVLEDVLTLKSFPPKQQW